MSASLTIASPVRTVPPLTTIALMPRRRSSWSALTQRAASMPKAFGELRTAGVRLLRHLDDRLTDRQPGTRRRVRQRQVEVDEELIAGERPAIPVAPGDEIGCATAHQIQLSLRVGPTVLRLAVGTFQIVVTRQSLADDQGGLVEHAAFVDGGPTHDHLDDAARRVGCSERSRGRRRVRRWRRATSVPFFPSTDATRDEARQQAGGHADRGDQAGVGEHLRGGHPFAVPVQDRLAAVVAEDRTSRADRQQ